MGLFDFGFGSKDEKQKQEAERTTIADVSESSRQVGETIGTERLNTRNVETTLNVRTRKALESLLFSSVARAGQPVGGRQRNVATRAIDASKLLATRAATGQEDIDEMIMAIISDRERQGQTAIRGQQARLSAAGGSALGSNVQQLGASSEAQLLSSLASEEAQLRLGAREQATQEILASLTAQLGVGELLEAQTTGRFSTLTQNAAVLGDVLRGARTVSTGRTIGKSTEASTVETDTIRKIIEEMQQKGEIKGGSSGFDLGFGI